MITGNEAARAQDTTPHVPPIPYMPQHPGPATAEDIARMIDSRIQLYAAEEAQIRKTFRNKQLAKEVAIGVGGLVVGGLTVYGVSKFRASRRARSNAMGGNG